MVASRVAGAIPILIAVCFLSLPSLAQYSGGSGTADDPYRIATADDLILLGETPEDYDKHFILTADIDLDPNLPGRKVFDRAVIAQDTDPNDEYSWFQGTDFNGVFDGNSHTVSRLTIVGGSYLGLFGEWGYEAEINDLGVIDTDIVGSGDNVGGLVGSAWRVTNCYSTGKVSGMRNVGGLTGYSLVVTDCYSNSTVGGTENVGGLVGYNVGFVRLSCSAGVVTGDMNVGGLVGTNHSDQTYYGPSDVTQCYSTSDVIGITSVGGLVGYNMGGFGSRVTQSYSNGSVSGSEYVGGLVGNQAGWVYDCYSTGAVSGDRNLGGLVGSGSPSSVTASFWDIENSGLSTSDGGTGLTTAKMQDPNTFVDAGWDFVSATDGPDDIWAEPAGGGYPILSWLWWQLSPTSSLPSFSGGTGQPDDPYLVSTAADLNGIGHNPRLMDAHFMLINDIDMTGIDYCIIGSELYPFTGVFDGHGHTISNFRYASTSENIGLFGYVRGAEIKDLGLVGPNIDAETGHSIGLLVGILENGNITNCYTEGGSVITGNDVDVVGGLVGRNYSGTITNCCAQGGSVRGTGYSYSVGGLVGSNSHGVITVCYVDGGSIFGYTHVGGLVGHNNGILAYCYASGSVAGTTSVGGLVGSNEHGSISMSYNTGPVKGTESVGGFVGLNRKGDVNACFWDIETSGLPNMCGSQDDEAMGCDDGYGKTTAEMQTTSTFLEAGWDFVGETENGPNDIWKMWDGYDYPRLAWEAGPNTLLVFVDINDPGFYGQMSQYEVANAQYCDFLNAALASGDITVNGTKVEGAGGSNGGEDYAGQLYYRSDGSGYTGYGATNGGAARIHYDAGAFGVDDGFGNHPVTYVSWYGAMAFANYYGYYLPAEDQWQAVADYDGTYIYGCGQTIDPGIANYRVSEHPAGTMPVASFGAYGYGMSDMAGNVWEWTSSSLGGNRVFRGGSLGSVESDCAVSIRGDGIPHAAYWDIGFRVCR